MSKQHPIPPKGGSGTAPLKTERGTPTVVWEHAAETIRETDVPAYLSGGHGTDWELVAVTRHEKEEQVEGIQGYRPWVKIGYITLYWKRRVGG